MKNPDSAQGARVVSPKGRPLIEANGRPLSLATYSPISWRGDFLKRCGPAFYRHGMGVYFFGISLAANAKVWGESPFWSGDEVTDTPTTPFVLDPDQQAALILEGDPDAWLLVRNLPTVVPSWNALHPDQLFHDEDGQRHDIPSLASSLWWETAAAAAAAGIRFCERRPWAHRIAGYWYGLEGEGTMPYLFDGKLYDHSPVMTARWRQWLREKYGTEARLREAYADASLTFDSVAVPKDRLRGRTEEAATLPYWHQGPGHQPSADYFDLLEHLFHAQVKTLFGRLRDAAPGPRVILTDAFKQAMSGWTNFGFFNPAHAYPLTWPETLAGSGSAGVASLLDHPGLDGVVTPIDYQLRGVGGITEPEGIVDSVVLRGKAFFAECDIRTWHDDIEKGAYGTARNLAEFDAINWRNVATGLTRGFVPYWMDLVGDWFGDAGIQKSIGRAAAVLREATHWPHTTVPGIAVILDDRATRETNGNGAYPHLAIMGDLKTGLSRCGVPYRIYLLEDLERADFPEHRVFYFPNLFRLTPEKHALLKRTVLQRGHLALWGPGTAIAGGAETAQELTGFSFDVLTINDPRRVQISDFDHPITAGLPADTFFGDSLAYGPLLTPTDGQILGTCWGRSGKARGGLAVKDFRPPGNTEEGWISVFSAAVPIPASLWRNLARHAGAHIYSESNDVLLASGEVVALHSIQRGPKELKLPAPMEVRDLVHDQVWGTTDRICFELHAPETRVFRLGKTS